MTPPSIVGLFESQLKSYLLKPRGSKGPVVREFYNTPALRKWLVGGEDGAKSNFERLLDHIRPHQDHSWTVSLESLSHGNDSCIMVFSCLQEFKQGNLIYCFYEAGIRDSSLNKPMDSDSREELKDILENILPEQNPNLRQEANNVIEDFEIQKWKFCPPQFTLGMKENFHERVIMPFCTYNRITVKRKTDNRSIDKGGTAEVFKVFCREDFLCEKIKKLLGEPKYEKMYGKGYQLAVKRYKEGQKHAFFNERDAFRVLHGEPGMFPAFAFYSQKEDDTYTYNILLECGKNDLSDSYKEGGSWSLPTEIISQWKPICQIADQIRIIHSSSREGDRVRIGVHGDIKPDNILFVRDEAKLIDFGFTEFIYGDTKDTEWHVGSVTYGAPEAGREKSRAIDMWSFGAVISVHATWIVSGPKWIEDFRNFRKKAPNIFEDSFHNGEEVLPQITEWHKKLRSVMRKSDLLTSEILDLVDDHMLQMLPERRQPAEQILNKLKAIINEAEQRLRDLEEEENWVNGINGLANIKATRLPNGVSQEHNSPSGSHLPSISPEGDSASKMNGDRDSEPEDLEGRLVAPPSTLPKTDRKGKGPETPSAVPVNLQVPKGIFTAQITKDPQGRFSTTPLIEAEEPLLPGQSVVASDSMQQLRLNIPDIFAAIELPEDSFSINICCLILQLDKTQANTLNRDDQTPIMVAASSLKLKLVEVLAEASDITKTDTGGMTVLHYLVQAPELDRVDKPLHKRLPATLDKLKTRHSGLMNQANHEGKTSLDYAKTLDLVQLLVRNGANISQKNFEQAVIDGKDKIVRFYMAEGDNIDTQSARIQGARLRRGMKAVLKGQS